MFCIEYALDCNGTRAYKAAFKTKNDDTARANAYKLLTNAHIREAVDKEIQAKLQGRREELKAIWINEVERLATARLEDFLDDDGYPDIDRMKKNPGIVAQFEDILNETQGEKSSSYNHHRKIKMFSKEKALEMLGKHTGMLKEEATKVGVTIIFGKEEEGF